MQDVDMTQYIKQATEICELSPGWEYNSELQKIRMINTQATKLYEEAMDKMWSSPTIKDTTTVEELKNIVSCTEIECIYDIKDSMIVTLGAIDTEGFGKLKAIEMPDLTIK